MEGGQKFIYDFVANNDIFPIYDNIPYAIAFSDTTHPSWLRIENNSSENNKLISDEIPEDCEFQQICNSQY